MKNCIKCGKRPKKKGWWAKSVHHYSRILTNFSDEFFIALKHITFKYLKKSKYSRSVWKVTRLVSQEMYFSSKQLITWFLLQRKSTWILMHCSINLCHSSWMHNSSVITNILKEQPDAQGIMSRCIEMMKQILFVLQQMQEKKMQWL